jgi:hypothetical protein
MSEALGPAGSLDFGAELFVSAVVVVTFFLAELTLT